MTTSRNPSAIGQSLTANNWFAGRSPKHNPDHQLPVSVEVLQLQKAVSTNIQLVYGQGQGTLRISCKSI
jgi:hypothetical protein